MPLYKYDDIKPIYNKYLKFKNNKVLLNNTLNAISLAEDLTNDLNTLLSKKEHTQKDIDDIEYCEQEVQDIDINKSLLIRYVIENFINKNIKPTKTTEVNVEYVNAQINTEASSSNEPQLEETQLEETQPEETQLEETQPEETQLEETQPKESQPEESSSLNEEFNKYVNDILKLSNIDLSDEELQTVLESYSIDTLIKVQKYNTNTKKAYEKLVDKKILFDRRKGRKTKEYGSLIKNIKLYEPLYILVKRMNSIIQNILKKRQITDQSTETIKNSFDIEKLKDLIKKYPELKENISSVLLSEFIKKDTVSKKDIDDIKQFIPEQKRYTQKLYTYLIPPKKQTLKTEIKYNVISSPSVSKTYSYFD